MAFATTIKKYVRSFPAGAGENSVTISVKKHDGSTEITSATTAGSGDDTGLATITLTDFEPHYLEATIGADTLTASSRDVGFIGTLSGYDLDLFGLAWTDGVLKGRDNELAATAAGTDMLVDIDTGAVIVLGHPARNTASAEVTITANASGSTRYDLIVVRFVPKGQTTEGDFSFAVVAGTPGAGVPPTVTQSASVWEITIASVLVANGATTIATGVLTDARTFCYPRALDLDSATLAGALPVTNGGTGAITAPLALVNLGLTATAAELNALDGITATVTELNYTDGVTSPIQTQLDAKQASDADLTTIAGLVDPNADRILFWDDSAGAYAYLTAGTGLSITTTTLTAAGGTPGAHTHPLAEITDDGTMASQAASAVAITGGTITGITDLPLADGGTGASLVDPNADRVLFWDDSAGAVTWLSPGTGLAITTTTLGLDADLTTIAGLTATTDNFLVAVASAWASRTPAQVRTTLALVIGTNVQAWDADLDTVAANITAAGHAILDDADVAAQRTTLGLVAAGTGDIWVEKAGDVMTGGLTTGGSTIIDVDSTSAFIVRRADNTNELIHDTVAHQLALKNATDLRVASDNGSSWVFEVDGATGNTDVAGTLDVAGTTVITAPTSITKTSASALVVEQDGGTNVLQVDTSNLITRISSLIYIFDQAAPGVPSGGGHLWVESGALKYRGSSGTITTIAPA